MIAGDDYYNSVAVAIAIVIVVAVSIVATAIFAAVARTDNKIYLIPRSLVLARAGRVSEVQVDFEVVLVRVAT